MYCAVVGGGVTWQTWLLGSAQQQHFLVLQSPKAEGVQQSVGQGWFLDCKMCVINVLRSGWWWCDLADLDSGQCSATALPGAAVT